MGLITYEEAEVLANIDSSLGVVLAAGAAAFICNYIYYGMAVRVGFRQRTHAIPVAANMYFFAHDIGYLLHFKRWFYEVNHWLFKAFWFGLIIFTILELIVHYQTLKYSRQELFPTLSQSQYVIVYAGMQIAIGAFFWVVCTHLADPFFLVNFSIAVFLSMVLNFPMMYGRRSQKGQSSVVAVSLLIGAIAFYFVLLPVLSPHFLTASIVVLGVLAVVMGAVYAYLLPRYPPYIPSDAAE